MRAMRRPAGADAAVPERRDGHVVLPEARARQRARLARDHDRQHAERHDVATRSSPPTSRTSSWAVNLGCLGFHVWPYLADDPEHADELRIDLDPQPGVGFDAGPRRGARGAGAARRARHRRHPKTTGNRGIHVYVRLEPRWDSYDVRAGRSRGRARARAPPSRPDHRAWWKEERGERIFIDFNQNAPHKTVFGAWSVRARAGAQVSTPFAWDELDDDRSRRRSRSRRCPSGRARRRSVGRHRLRIRSRSSRCSTCRSAISTTGLRTRRGRPCTRRCPANPVV